MQGIPALEFFTADLLNGTKLYVFGVIEHGTRRIGVLGVLERIPVTVTTAAGRERQSHQPLAFALSAISSPKPGQNDLRNDQFARKAKRSD